MAEQGDIAGKILEQVGKLSAEVRGMTELMEVKFDGVHRRQDITNGRIGKAEENIIGLTNKVSTLDFQVTTLDQKETAHIKKTDNRTWELVKVMGMMFLGVITYLVSKAFDKIFI